MTQRQNLIYKSSVTFGSMANTVKYISVKMKKIAFIFLSFKGDNEQETLRDFRPLPRSK